ncbi:hypothetical protein G7Y89_g9549 [Cudoniella acicularis]|uniref:Uncharacterized protein n=1 Tax=Cudoniella acicularis TaxID=354080 RepID=A0A8H4VZX6_9HELO|nr:hypothetical protein G7Y89_g9549 [Cudoniella acicularis]
MSPEVFEKLYLSPENVVKGGLRNAFGNPTRLALVGFPVALSPLSIELMGWRGATGLSATIGVNYYFGGALLTLSGTLEIFLGNTFPSVVFFAYGAHSISFASTFQPSTPPSPPTPPTAHKRKPPPSQPPSPSTPSSWASSHIPHPLSPHKPQ